MPREPLKGVALTQCMTCARRQTLGGRRNHSELKNLAREMQNEALFPTFYSYTLEKAMASHSSTLDWKIPWTEEPGGLQSMGSLRVGHD